ncbi:MAG: M3 family metallopeptidase [Alphaproteobacteria bacterium]|nr:M3 family metallopeptidase [Alphaproteobacteria bacterium]
MSSNPFSNPWAPPFGVPPYDLIRPAHLPDAIDRGMREHNIEIAAIVNNAEPPSFVNTVEALERSGALLERALNVFSNLLSSIGSDELQAIETEFAPKLSQHASGISLDPALFGRVDMLYRQRAALGLDAPSLRLLERHHLGFIRAGAHLGAADKLRMAAISERLAVLHAEFGQNVVHDEREWHLPLVAADLDGLPDFVREGAQNAARARGHDGYTITLSRSLIEPFLTFSRRRDLRQIAYLAFIARGEHTGPHDNRRLIPEILVLRAERARLLGFKDYAAFRLADTMAATQDNVERLTGAVWSAARHAAAAERDRLLLAASADGINDRLEPWDWRHYAERVRLSEYAIDEAELKPYFVLENIQQAAFDTANRLFGLSFHAMEGLPLYHPDVRAWEVRDADGHVGVFIADNYARPGKRSGAWMSSLRDQQSLDGPVSPIILNNNNFSQGTPTLLSFDDAGTLFHEFGHALHGLLSRVRYPSQSGTSVRRDFVEFPSQIYEHWLAVPETLRRFARHHQTGTPIPDALIQRLLAARTFNQGFATIEYTASAILDMALHTHPDPATLDVAAFEREVLDRIGMPAEIGARHRPAHFQHLFAGAGYAAGYYSYLWAEVLDADGFGVFQAAGDPFDPALAARLRRILESGDTEDPMALYVAFRGEQPGIDALLRHRGLTRMTTVGC